MSQKQRHSVKRLRKRRKKLEAIKEKVKNGETLTKEERFLFVRYKNSKKIL